MPARPNQIPKDAVLLIPEPEDEHAPAPYGVAPGYYNLKQMLELLDKHHHNADAIQFIADMLETGNAEDDGFAQLLRAHQDNPAEIAQLLKAAAT